MKERRGVGSLREPECTVWGPGEEMAGLEMLSLPRLRLR